MKEVEPRVKERVGRSPDARALVSIWTEKGWKRIIEVYFVSPSQQEINALHDLAESLDEASVDLNETVKGDSDEVALLSYPKPGVQSSL